MLAAFALFAPGMILAGEDFSTWSYSAKLRLNTTGSGANVPKSIGNFAMLVRITDNRILTQSMSTGADVRFADEQGAPLDFQIETWNPAAKKAEIWVRIPKVDSLSDKQFLNVYWGKPGAAWVSDANKTFIKDVSYTMVYHLGEASTQARTNSVGNYNHGGTRNYDGDERVQGIIGMADSLDGSSRGGDYLDLGAGFTDLTMFSFTAWAKPRGAGMWERFIDLGNGEAVENLTFSRANASDSLSVHAFGAPTPYNPYRGTGGLTDLGYVNSGKALEADKWGFYGFSVYGKSVWIYKNGERIKTGEWTGPLNKVLRLNNYIGHSNWPGDVDFMGVLDEVQMFTGLHSPEWMKLSYESQRPDAKMFTWEFPAAVQLAISAQPVGATVAEGKPINLNVTAISGAAISYQWYRDGTILAGATAPAYSVASATLAHSGMYTCRLTDGKDTVVSKPAAIFVPEELSTWSHSQKVFINTTASGANLSGEVANIPILVRLGKASLTFTQVGEGGKDLRFATADGVALAHSIERWATDTAEVWVRVTKVAANANGYFMMYWGKTAARQGSSPGNVFSLNDGWRVYYDFSDAPSTGGDAQAKDATLNSWRGFGAGITSIADGAIGKAFAFSGSSRMESPVQAMDGLKAFTVQAWVREKATSTSSNVLEMPHYFTSRLSAGGQGEFGAFSNNGAAGFWGGFKEGTPFIYHTTGAKVGDKAWHLVSVAYTGTSLNLYVDGISLASMPTETLALGPNPLAIGGSRATNGTWGGMFTGDIDAVQATGDAKGKDWIKLAYETQRPGSAVLTLGNQADLTPPAPSLYPPAGQYDEAIGLQITCAADSARILYTLDGTEPDTAAKGSTRIASVSPIPIAASVTVKAKAYWKGKSSPTSSAAYQITAATANGDTLRPGTSKNIDATHRVTFPNQDSKSPVRLAAGPAWNPPPPGFDRVGPRFTLTAVDTAAAFPGLALEGDSLAGLSLFRRDPNAVIVWMPPKDGQLWIPGAGTYFWGRDTLPPRIRYTGSGARGDSLMAWIIIDDNVAGIQGKIVWNGGKDSLGWWSAAAGEVLEFTLPIPADPATPLEVRFSAHDQTRAAKFPKSGAITLPRPVPALAAPLDLKPGIQWKMAGMPLLSESSLSLRELAQMSGTGPLYAAVWRNPSPDGGYLLLKDDDKLPAGKGFWLASETAAPSLNFPASRAVASDSDGLFTLALEKGWNLVTCPSFRPLAWPVSVKDGDVYLRSPLKPLHGLAASGYSRPDSLRPWEAYYVWYDKDTTVRIGEGAPRVADAAKAPKSASAAKSLRLNLSGPGALLDLGATAFARPGLGREDESRPPPVDDRAAAWLAREGETLAADYVSWDPDRAMAWTIASRAQSPGSAFSVSEAALPPGIEAWAVSPARRLKWRLLPGSNIPVTGDDTLSVYAGTARALAKIGDLLRGREAAGAFAARLRPAAGGLELLLELPGHARLDITLYDTRGRRLGGIAGRALAAGRHAFTWQSLSLRQSKLPQGAYYMVIDARAPDWSRHQVLPATLIQ